MGALDDAAIVIGTLIVALNQIQTLLAAETASINTTCEELVGQLGSATNTQVLHAVRATINATQRLTEATDQLRSAVNSVDAFATELGLPGFTAVQPKPGDALPTQAPHSPAPSRSPATVGQVRSATIDDTHTDYVAAGTSVLVHSCDKDMTTMGCRGKPFRGGAPNAATQIGGRTFTGHALDRMQQQGIVPSAVEDAISGPATPGKRPGTSAYYSETNDLTVIVDTQSGRVITADYGRIRQ